MAADRRVGRSATAGNGLDAGVSRSELILDAAIELFRAHGYHSVGIDEIGAKAGITGPGVYRHFPSKPSLLVELFTRVSERLVVEGRRLANAAASPICTWRGGAGNDCMGDLSDRDGVHRADHMTQGQEQAGPACSRPASPRAQRARRTVAISNGRSSRRTSADSASTELSMRTCSAVPVVWLSCRPDPGRSPCRDCCGVPAAGR